MTGSSEKRDLWWTGRCAVIAALTIAVSGCASAFRPEHHFVPGPAGALAAAPLSGNRVAILAGSDDAKGVYVLSLDSGSVVGSFGVTKEATGLAAEGADGPLLVSVGAVSPDGRPVGALERWTLTGSKQRVVPMPAEADGVTKVIDGVAYVLLRSGDARAALPIESPLLRVGKPIPLDAGARELEQCKLDASDYLVYTEGDGLVAMREIDSGRTLHSAVVADDATCLTGKPRVYAIQKSFAARSIAVLEIPDLAKLGAVPASNDASELYETLDHHVLALNATSRLSNLETFGDQAFEPTTLTR
jgi:hypothetical protein